MTINGGYIGRTFKYHSADVKMYISCEMKLMLKEEYTYVSYQLHYYTVSPWRMALCCYYQLPTIIGHVSCLVTPSLPPLFFLFFFSFNTPSITTCCIRVSFSSFKTPTIMHLKAGLESR